MADDTLSTVEAAAELGVTDQAIRNMINRDALPGATRVGDRWRVPRKAVEARKAAKA